MIQCQAWVDPQWEVEWVILKGHHQEQFKYHKRKWKQLIVYSNLDSQRHVPLKHILHVIKMKKWQQTSYLRLVLKMKKPLFKLLLLNLKHNNREERQMLPVQIHNLMLQIHNQLLNNRINPQQKIMIKKKTVIKKKMVAVMLELAATVEPEDHL